MNEHIKRGNEAMRIGDIQAAKEEFYLALDDPDWLTRPIADLYVANLDVADLFSYDALTLLTGQHQRFEDGSVIHAVLDENTRLAR